jgi:hypothetical protein
LNRHTLGACAGVLAVLAVCTLPLRSQRERGGDASSPASALRAQLRDDALQRARIRLRAGDGRSLMMPPPDVTGTLTRASIDCQFVPHATGGTSYKFDCALDDGEIVRVKYGHEPEIHGEVAATRLVSALGYAADHVYLVPHLTCHGCPPTPFVTTLVLDTLGAPPWRANGTSDFEWVAVERKFAGIAIEDSARAGWAWWELTSSAAPREELDALRLLAVFLAHWDNKADNQRLVCLDEAHADETSPCRDPLLMIQDLGSTFGPLKVNLSQWRQMPLWIERSACSVSMKMLPYGGGTFTDARIVDSARVRLGKALASFTDEELRGWLSAARFPQYYASTDDAKDLDAWLSAYRHRVSEILNAGPCPS